MHSSSALVPPTQPRSGLRDLIAAIRESFSGKEHDCTRGSLHRSILILAIPMILEMGMEAVFAVVDLYYVGMLGSDAATAAVGLTESVLTLMYALAIGLSMGTGATVARRIGEGNKRAASAATFQAILVALALSSIVSVAGFFFAPEILGIMQAEPEVIEVGAGYTRTLLTTNAVIMLLFVVGAAFRGAGDPMLAMKSLVLANGLNLVLDPILIFGWGPVPAFGLQGAAIATTIGRGTGVAYVFWVLARGRGRLHIDRSVWKVDVAAMLRLLRVSAGGIAQLLIATASWVVLMSVVARFGDAPVAGYTIAVRILMFTFLPAWGLSNAAPPLVGQNLGAGQPDRAERAVWLTGIYNMVFLACVTVVFLVFAEDLVAIFDPGEVTAGYAVEALQVISYGYIAYAWGMVMMQAFNGAGDTMTPTKINFVCFWLLQIPVAYALAVYAELGPTGVFWSVMGTEALLAVISMLIFRRGRWKTREV